MRDDSVLGIGNRSSSPNTRVWRRCRKIIVRDATPILSVLLLAFAALTVDADATEQRLASSFAYLNERGLTVSADSSAADLAEAILPLLIDDATLARTLRYIADLRADDFGTRENASRALVKLAFPIDSLLVMPSGSASRSQDFTWRVQQILALRRPLALEDQLHHALAVVAEKPVRGMIAQLLSTASAVEHGDMQLLATVENALVASAAIADKEILRLHLAPEHSVATRKRATVALASILSGTNDDEFDQLIASHDPDLRLAAAKGAALAGHRFGVPMLVSLLESSRTAVRCEAAEVLYACTGMDFGFAGYDDTYLRESSVKHWKQWLSSSQDGGRLVSAVPPALAPTGRVIVGIQLKEEPPPANGQSRGQKNALERSNVIEFTPSGSIRWHMRSTDLRGGTAIASIPMREGGRAIAFGNPEQVPQQSMSIRFFDHTGLGIGTITGLAGMPSLGLTSNGNLMIAAANEIVEVGCAGNLVSRTAFSSFADTIDHFELIRADRVIVVSSMSGTVREYTRGGRLLLEWNQLPKPVYARRHRDGSLLVAQHAQDAVAIASYDATGQLQWTFSPSPEIGKMSAVAALSNGNALFGSSTGMYEIGCTGRIVRTWINGSVDFIYVD